MTKNDYTTLVSCRIDNQTLKAIDKFCEGRRYLKRSGVINQALIRIFRDSEGLSIYRFLYEKKQLTPCDTSH